MIWTGKRKLTGSTSLKSGQNNVEAVINNPHRGIYSGYHYIRIEDIFSFFRFSICLDEIRNIRVRPPRPEDTSVPPVINYAAELSVIKKESEEELYESRQYYPGDDPRKIHWKQYAHTGDLFIRTGEEGAPYIQKAWCVLLPGKNPVNSNDAIIESFLSLIMDLLKQNMDVYTLLPGINDYRNIKDTEKFRLDLAGILSQDHIIKNPVPDKGLYIIVTSPGNIPLIEKWTDSAATKGLHPLIYLKSPEQPQKKTLSVKKLLFRDLSRDTGPEKIGRRMRTEYLKEFEKDRQLLKLMMKGKGYVREI